MNIGSYLNSIRPDPALLGADGALTALSQRVFDALKDSDDPPLIVGLYGEWGSGKSFWMAHLRYRVVTNKINYPERNPGDEPDVVIIPIFFNAWRYEKEPHLIIPLLKTTLYELKRWDAMEATWKSKLTEGIKSLSASVAALSWTLAEKVDKDIFGTGILDLLYKGRDREADLKDQMKSALHTLQDKVDALESHQFELQSHLTDIAALEIGDKPVRLLFLIDDLDRCLPEKAVEMLESIKLFLDVPGTAYVLAVDDEVVERGVEHRYRDYLFHSASKRSDIRSPITGNEYLEKIISLPVRVDRPDEKRVLNYIQEKCPALNDLRTSLCGENPVSEVTLTQTLQVGDVRSQSANGQVEFDLLMKAIPPVPRKLLRLSESFRLRKQILGFANDNKNDAALIRIVALQLFAPEVYRVAARARHWEVLRTLREWQTKRVF